MFAWLMSGSPRTTKNDRKRALAQPPVEDITFAAHHPTLVVGGRQTRGALPLQTSGYSGAVFSSKGRGPYRFNEDAAVLARDGRGRVLAAVFDQAGGLGGDVRGEASALAARTVFESFRGAKDPGIEPSAFLVDALWTAHRALLDRRQGEATTAVVAVGLPGSVVIANSGDSGALWFRKGEGVLAETAPQESLAPATRGRLTHALGLDPEEPSPELYTWSVEPDDWVLIGSDGLLDANLSESDLRELLEGARDPVDFVNRLADIVLKKMEQWAAKPDNLSIVALVARSGDDRRCSPVPDCV